MNNSKPADVSVDQEETGSSTKVDSDNITELVRSLSSDKGNWSQLIPLVYWQLKRMAVRQLPFGRQGSVSPTVLVNELFLRLVDSNALALTGRAHFFAVAARAMRQISLDHIKAKKTAKRGGDVVLVGDVEQASAIAVDNLDVERVDEALKALSREDPLMVTVVECRFFIGLTDQETADALGLSYHQVQHTWRRAKKWLAEYLET